MSERDYISYFCIAYLKYRAHTGMSTKTCRCADETFTVGTEQYKTGKA